RLGPLQGNGGPTASRYPLPGSPAIDAGSNPAGLTTDQTGGPRVQGAAADIGAVEHVPGVPTGAGGLFAPVVTVGGAAYQFTVTYYDDSAINVSTLNGTNVRVTGPNGFSATATFVAVDATTNGSPRTATYSIAPPGANWTVAADGAYTVAVQAN